MAVERPENDGRDVVAGLAPLASLYLTLVVSFCRLAVVCALVCFPYVPTEARIVFADQVQLHQKSEVNAIPLNTVWGFNIPRTRGNLIDEIMRREEIPGSMGFAVAGTGAKGLIQAHNVLVNKQPAVTDFSDAAELSVVFFSRPFAWRCHVHHIVRRGNEIEVGYQIAPARDRAGAKRAFALIPLGTLPTGKYRVTFLRVPMENAFLKLGFKDVSEEEAKLLVCNSFQFTVTNEEESQRSRSTNASHPSKIPLDQVWAYESPGTNDVRELDALETFTTPDGKQVPVSFAASTWGWGQDATTQPSKVLGSIVRKLESTRPDDATGLQTGFAVNGVDSEALREAQSILAMGKTFVSPSLSEHEEVTLIFFTSLAPPLRLQQIRRCKNTIHIEYQLGGRFQGASFVHVALIPVGRLSAGEYDVAVRSVDTPDVSNPFVSGSFQFRVGQDAQ